jgi:hypothetical protein
MNLLLVLMVLVIWLLFAQCTFLPFQPLVFALAGGEVSEEAAHQRRYRRILLRCHYASAAIGLIVQ